MNTNNYVDVAAIAQVIGCVFNDSSILDEKDKYTVSEQDFPEIFHQTIFGAMYNLHLTGSKVTLDAIVDYLANRPKSNGIFLQGKGPDYLAEASRIAKRDTFNYYYNRMKKFSLLRAYSQFMDISDLYDASNVMDVKLKQQQEEWLDNTSLVDIVKTIDKKIDDIKIQYVDDDLGAEYQAADDIDQLLADLERHPEVGIAMYGRLINTVTRGARLRKFYLRSAATGVGKTRSMIADACTFACDSFYDENFGWVKLGAKQPTLFIATEQDKGEVQTMMLAFLSNVNEEHILNPMMYLEGERERVQQAVEVLKRAPIWIEELPDFSLTDVENKIKKNIREHDVKYVLFDYLQTSLKILEEISKKSGGVKLREDNILFMLSAKLKDIANIYGVFVLTATQLNASYQESETPDQNLLRGAKSIADRADWGAILLSVTKEDQVKLEPLISANPNLSMPNVKMSIYKNRRGAYKGIFLWCQADLGTCRINPMFATDWSMNMKPIEDIKVEVNQGPGAWED